jgi:hypothetical protein
MSSWCWLGCSYDFTFFNSLKMFIDRFIAHFLACVMLPDPEQYNTCIDNMVIEMEANTFDFTE